MQEGGSIGEIGHMDEADAHRCKVQNVPLVGLPRARTICETGAVGIPTIELARPSEGFGSK